MADINALAMAMIAAKQRKEECEGALREASRDLEAADRALFDALADAGLSKVSVGGFSFTPDVKDYYSVPAERMDEFRDAMEALGRGGIFRVTAHPATLQAALRELASEDDGALPGRIGQMVSTYHKQRCTMRRGGTR